MKSTLITWIAIGLTWPMLAGLVATSAEFRSLVGTSDRSNSRPQPEKRVFPGLDPPVGSEIVLPQLDLSGAPIRFSNPGGRILLAYLAHCSACRQDAIAPELLPYSEFDRVVIVHSDEAVINRVRVALPANARLLLDESGELRRLLNASAPPRYYLLSGDLKLLDMQSTPGVLPPFVKVEEPEL